MTGHGCEVSNEAAGNFSCASLALPQGLMEMEMVMLRSPRLRAPLADVSAHCSISYLGCLGCLWLLLGGVNCPLLHVD